jgi:hypothetical protein
LAALGGIGHLWSGGGRSSHDGNCRSAFLGAFKVGYRAQ